MKEQLLNYVKRFIQPTPEEAEYFLSLFKSRKYLKKQFVVQAGDICLVESFVVSGCLRSYFVDVNGEIHIVQFAVENWWISDMESLIKNVPSKLNIDALVDSEVLQIEKADFENLLVKFPKFEKMFRLMLSNAFISHQRRIIDNLSVPAKERYLNFIKNHRDVEQLVPQHHIASYLGMTPEFLSQIRKKLTSEKFS
jgi:CRP-like cAMP-binding protein